MDWSWLLQAINAWRKVTHVVGPGKRSIIKMHRDLARSLHYLDHKGVLRARRDDVPMTSKPSRQRGRWHNLESGKVLMFLSNGQLTSKGYRERRETGRIELKRRRAAKKRKAV